MQIAVPIITALATTKTATEPVARPSSPAKPSEPMAWIVFNSCRSHAIPPLLFVEDSRLKTRGRFIRPSVCSGCRLVAFSRLPCYAYFGACAIVYTLSGPVHANHDRQSKRRDQRIWKKRIDNSHRVAPMQPSIS